MSIVGLEGRLQNGEAECGEAVIDPCLGSSIELVLPNPIRNNGYPPSWDCEDSSSILVNNLNVEVTFGLRQITSGRFTPNEHSRHHQRNAVRRLQARNIQAAWIFQTAKVGPDVNVIGRHGYNRVAKEAPPCKALLGVRATAPAKERNPFPLIQGGSAGC
jgi:hypothetical protein